MTTRVLFGLALGVLLPAWATAQDCESCGPRLRNSFNLFNRGCNLRPYPQLETQYIKQFCGPHVSPDSCFGYFKPCVTSWGQACPNYRRDEPYAMNVALTPAMTATPAPTPTMMPPRETPMPVPQVPPPKSESAPLPKTGSLPPTSGLSSSLPPVAEPNYGPPPLPTIPTVPVSVRHH